MIDLLEILQPLTNRTEKLPQGGNRRSLIRRGKCKMHSVNIDLIQIIIEFKNMNETSRDGNIWKMNKAASPRRLTI